MLLYLIRHASASDLSETGMDFDRSLNNNGVLQAKQLGVFLDAFKKDIDNIYVSNSRRTRETANYLFDSSKIINYEDSLYLSDAKSILRFINSLQTKGDLLIIGHNEGVSLLASYLINQSIFLDTANALIIKFESDNAKEISGGLGTLIHFFSPNSL